MGISNPPSHPPCDFGHHPPSGRETWRRGLDWQGGEARTVVLATPLAEQTPIGYGNDRIGRGALGRVQIWPWGKLFMRGENYWEIIHRWR